MSTHWKQKHSRKLSVGSTIAGFALLIVKKPKIIIQKGAAIIYKIISIMKKI